MPRAQKPIGILNKKIKSEYTVVFFSTCLYFLPVVYLYFYNNAIKLFIHTTA
jgi:hypothetical protein